MANKAQREESRLRIAVHGLTILRDTPAPLLLKNIFILPSNSSASDFREANHSQARKWQSRMLDQLIKDGVVTVNGQQGYMPVNKERLREIVDNYTDFDGSLISDLVYPSRKKVSDKMLADALQRHGLGVGGDDAGTEPEADEAADEADEDDGAKEKWTASSVAEELLSALVERFNKLIGVISDNQRQFDGLIKTSKDQQEDVLLGVAAIQDKIEQKDRSVAKRIDQMEMRVSSLQTVIEAIQRTLKASLFNLEELTKHQNNASALVAGLAQLSDLIVDLNKNVRLSMEQTAQAQQDKLGQLLRRLDLQVSESAQLRGMILEQLAESETEQKALQANNGNTSQ